MGGVLTAVLIVGVLAWLFAPGRRRPPDPADPTEPADRDELEAAEREVRDLGTGQQPEDGFAGDDWGPGAPKQ